MSYPTKYPNHHKALNAISEDKDEVIKCESTKWISSIQKYFADNPVIQQDSKNTRGSKAFQRGSNLDLVQKWIFPKLERNDQVISLLNCKSLRKKYGNLTCLANI